MAHVVVPGYRIVAPFIQGRGTTLYRAVREADDAKVVIKMPSLSDPRPRAAAHLKRELSIARELASADGVLAALDLVEMPGGPALILEDFGGRSLDQMIDGPMPIERFLRLGIAIARAVSEIHQHHVIHKDIKPHNILVNEASGRVKIGDFGIASLRHVEQSTTSPVSVIEGSLPYLSPEQTGRLNRSIDHRTDLYSFGITLYEMLTGALPFYGKDPLEWVHCHLARTPAPLETHVPDVPKVVSAIVQKLIAKSADERYQSAAGVVADLEACQSQLELSGHIEPFPLGTREVPDRFQIPQRLYGRDVDIRRLLEGWNRVVGSGSAEIALVGGYSGIGKSSLVHELSGPLVGARGFFATGKFDQLRRDVPYATMIQALRSLVRELLTEDERTLERWRDRLQGILGANGRVVSEVIPEVELIIGATAPLAQLGPTEARNRFNLVFRSFIQAFADAEHPLVLFLDDMQWADMATYELLGTLMLDGGMHHLYLILAYRDNEVSAAHPFMQCIDKLRAAGAAMSEIVLTPLDLGCVTELLADTLACSSERCADLAGIVHRKTFGNPFFVLELLHALNREGFIAFDKGSGQWRWDAAMIDAKGYTDNVVELLRAQIADTDSETQRALRLAACIGNDFTLGVLSVVAERTEAACVEALWPAIRMGLVRAPLGYHHGDEPEPDALFRFQHDRIQQAAYSLIDSDRRQEVHLRIGRLLLAGTAEADLDDQIFNIANHLNTGASLIVDASEKLRLLQLNLRAGKKAKSSTAYVPARNYFAAAERLAPPDIWETSYDLALELWMDHAECIYLCGDFTEAEERFAAATEKAQSRRDLASLYELRMQLYQVAGRYAEGVDLAFECLRRFDIEIPASDAELEAALGEQLAAAKRNLGGRRIADLIDAKVMTDPDQRAVVNILVAALPCAYIGRPAWFGWLLMVAVNASLVHGNTEASCFVYSAYGFLLIAVFGELRAAFEFSEMSLKLNERFNDPVLRGTLLHLHGDHFNYWSNPIATDFPFLDRAFVACQEVGNLVYSGFIAFEIVWQAIERGDALEDVVAFSRRYETFARQTSNLPVLETIKMQQQLCACLAGRTRGLDRLDDDHYDEIKGLQLVTEASFGCGVVFHHIIKQILHYHAGDLAASLRSAREAAKTISAAMAMPIEATHYIYLALTLIALCPSRPEEEQAAMRREIDDIVRRVRLWTDSCPANFRDRSELISAELARLEGRPIDAQQHYEKAIVAARELGFVHHEALAHELAASYYEGAGLYTAAEAHRSEAFAAFVRWGAHGKAKTIEPARPLSIEAPAPRGSTTHATRSEWLDVLTAVKVQQAISKEIVLANLLRTLMHLLVEHAGAQTGALMLVHGDELMVEATADLDGGKIVVATHPVSSVPLPASVIAYVRRAHESVIVNHASGEQRFANDAYLMERRPRSVLCLPILKRSALMGLLYLENAHVSGVFTPERLALLELLAAQAAISLETARLYDDLRASQAELEERVQSRTLELQRVHKQMVGVAHRAGMAEIASNVLHNVGNALNSLNVGAALVTEDMERLPLDRLTKLADILSEQAHRLPEFFASDERARPLPAFVVKLSQALEKQRGQIVREMRAIGENIDQIKTIIGLQQDYAHGVRLREEADLCRIMDDAVRVHLFALERNGIEVVRQYPPEMRMVLDRSQVLQILVNLVDNAHRALASGAADEKRLTLRVSRDEKGSAFAEVIDNGAGISPEHLPRVFLHGFTTRGAGHGHGLHDSINVARSMGGDITAESDGVGCGATFRLTLPLASGAGPRA